MRAAAVAVAVVASALVGYGMGLQPDTVGGCYVIDVGTPGDPWPVLVADDAPDGLCPAQDAPTDVRS